MKYGASIKCFFSQHEWVAGITKHEPGGTKTYNFILCVRCNRTENLRPFTCKNLMSIRFTDSPYSISFATRIK